MRSQGWWGVWGWGINVNETGERKGRVVGGRVRKARQVC